MQNTLAKRLNSYFFSNFTKHSNLDFSLIQCYRKTFSAKTNLFSEMQFTFIFPTFASNYTAVILHLYVL